MSGAQQQALTFGALNLIGTSADLARDGYVFEVLAESTEFGDPVPVEAQVVSWLEDAALVVNEGFTNREFSVRVRVKGGNSNDLARAKAALDFETEKRNQLVWTPPDGFGAASVFEVVMSHSKHEFDDLGELRTERVYRIEFQAEAFVHAQELTTVTQAAPAGSLNVQLIDDCSSLTANWEVLPGPGNASGGAIRTSVSGPSGSDVYIAFTRFGLSEDMTATPYLRVDWGWSVGPGSVTPGLTKYVSARAAGSSDAVDLAEVASSGTVSWYDYGGAGLGSTLGTVSMVLIRPSYGGGGASVTWQGYVAEIHRTNSLVDSGATNRQLARTIPVRGSARAQGSIAIEDESDALGDCLVFTYPTESGVIQPNLRRFLSSGNTETPDSSTVSGSTSDLSVLHTFDIPADQLLPGAYLLLAKVKHATAGDYDIDWAAKTRQGSNTISGGQSGTSTITVDTNGEYDIVVVAKPNLPPRLLGPDGVVRIELTGDAGLVLDEAWVFNVEVGRLSKFTLTTGTPESGGTPNRAWLDAPSLASPRRALYVGTEADRSDSYHLENGIESLDLHELIPPSTTAFVVTANSSDAALTVSYYARYQSHVVDEDA